MRLFTIKELERISGLKAHTIRTWEIRFNLFTPERNSNNVRLYTLDDVLLIQDVTLLLQHRNKISRLAILPKEEIRSKALLINTIFAKQHRCISQLVSCIFRNDIDQFESELDRATRSFGIAATIDNIIIPFLEKVNLTSYNDTTINTHFAITAIRRKIMLGIENTNVSKPTKSVLLFLPKDEHYDLTLLYLHYVLKTSNIKVYYLGTNISTENLALAIREKMPDFVVMYVVDTKRSIVDDYVKVIENSNIAPAFLITYAYNVSANTASQSQNAQYCRYDLLFEILKNVV